MKAPADPLPAPPCEVSVCDRKPPEIRSCDTGGHQSHSQAPEYVPASSTGACYSDAL